MGNGCKGEGEVLARDLSEAFGNKSYFEARNLASFVMLYVEHPFALNSLAARGISSTSS